MSPTENTWSTTGSAAERRWRPLSLVGVFASSNQRASALMYVWIGLSALCVWWPLADNGLIGPLFAWNRLPLHVAGVDLVLGFYLPWTVGVCLVMWLGLEWAAVPVYLATLFSTLLKGMHPDIAVVNALHNPLALAVYFLFYCNYKRDYSLRSLHSWVWFVLASLCAAIASSLGAFISEFTNTPLIGGGDFLKSWLGWWPNAFFQSVVINGPIIYFFSPAVEQVKQRYFPRGQDHAYTQRELLLAASMFALMLVLFLLSDDRWMAGRVQNLLATPMPAGLRQGIINEVSTQRVVIWIFALLLAAISLGGVFFTSRWAQRLRARFDQEARDARNALRRSESNFRNFFENSPAPMLLYVRETGAFVDVNRAALDAYGYTRGEFLEMTVYDIRPKEDVARFRQHMKEVAGSHAEHRYAGEWRHLTKDGVLLYVEIRVSALVMDNRALNLVLVHDISPRRHAQAVVERRARELQQLAAASLQIAGLNTVEEVLQVAADRARELSGARLAATQSWPEEDQALLLRASTDERYADWMQHVSEPKLPGIYQLLKDKQYPIRLSGQELEAHPEYLGVKRESQASLRGLLAVPLTSSEASVVGALMVSDKINGEFDAEDEAILVQLAQIASVGMESVRLKDALRQHMLELEERVTERTAALDASNKELDAFAYSVAHDLRAPLRAMHGFADAVQEDYGAKLDEAGRDYLRRIIKGAKSMDTLIQDLLSYSRVGKDKTALEGVPLGEVLQEVLGDLHAEIESSKAVMDVAVPPLTVLAHRATLKTVLLNLVSNALKFVAPGTRPRVRIWALSRRGMVEICVRDNGIGIAPEHQERIFNVFERLHGAEAYPGTGIGLSIVKKGLASMQGEISIESDASGSTFNARLKEYRNGRDG